MGGLCLYTYVWGWFGVRSTCLCQPNNLINNLVCVDSMLSSVLSQSHIIHMCDTLLSVRLLLVYMYTAYKCA